MRIFKTLLALTLFCLTSCGSDYGNSIISPESNLTVYYLDGVSSETAVKFAKYWKENGYTDENPQSIQLSIDKDYQIKLIAQVPGDINNMSFDEEQLLISLTKELEKEVFDNMPVQIMLCNDRFSVIKVIQ